MQKERVGGFQQNENKMLLEETLKFSETTHPAVLRYLHCSSLKKKNFANIRTFGKSLLGRDDLQHSDFNFKPVTYRQLEDTKHHPSNWHQNYNSGLLLPVRKKPSIILFMLWNIFIGSLIILVSLFLASLPLFFYSFYHRKCKQTCYDLAPWHSSFPSRNNKGGSMQKRGFQHHFDSTGKSPTNLTRLHRDSAGDLPDLLHIILYRTLFQPRLIWV